ncbi:hypothetical protein STEG23_020739, partial [Scotinomys teguina]
MARKAGQGEEEEVAQSQAGEGKMPVRHEKKKPACHGGGHHVVEQGNFDGKFEALDLAELTKKQPWWRKLFGQESGPSAEKYSVATQLLIGGVTGWCTGFIFQKVGKLAATAVGGGFFLLQLANHTGYIKVDWQRVEKDMKKAKEQLKIRKNNEIPTEVKSKAEE